MSSPSPSLRAYRALRALVPVVLLAVLLERLGTHPFERSLQVLRPLPILAALLLGALTTTAQALRWRTVATGFDAGAGLTRWRAVAECYRSGFLNSVLPGGVLGDVVRAWRQRPARERGLRTSLQAVLAERAAGTAALLAAGGVLGWSMSPWLSAAALIGVVIAVLVARPGLKRLTGRQKWSVWAWSAGSLAALVAKFGVVAAVLGTVTGPRDVVTLAVIVLAGMSVPFGIGGFGPREAVAALAFTAAGLSADAGVATSAGYGVLAAVSALPGVLVMLLDLHRDAHRRPAGVPALDQVHDLRLVGGLGRGPEVAEVQLDADVLAELEPARRSA